MLWHQLMGHIGVKGICAMHSKGMVQGPPDFFEEVEFFEHCIYGKHSCLTFSSGATRA